MTEHKSFVPQFKAADDDGSASWVMATLNTIDHDGDVILPGSIGRQDISILPAHNDSHVPLGKGVVFESGDEAIVEAKFNLDIPAARDWHSAIKFDLANPPSVQEYSFGYELLPGGFKAGEFNGQRVRFFQPKGNGQPGVDVFESSPVLRGSGINTRTLAAKSREGLKFSEHIEAVVADVDVLIARASDVVALRAEKGKAISDEALERLAALKTRLDALLVAPATDTSESEIESVLLHSMSLLGAHQ